MAARQTSDPTSGKSPRGRWATPSRRRRLLLRYWSISYPSNHGWRRLLRVAYIQPLLGVIFMVAGGTVAILEWTTWHFLVAEITGAITAALGLVLAAVSYPISVAYYNEYPGKFDERLEEYVARRISRLRRDEFIPYYWAHNNTSNQKTLELNKRVSLALDIEKLRLRHGGHTATAPMCGILVVGAEHTNKTGALWDAMTLKLNGWTFVRWPHHMDYPANLTEHLGRRVVLWIDDLHEFARSGEAAAVVQFIQDMRENGQRFLVLASCQDNEHLQEAERFFRPLMSDLQRVHAIEPLPATEQIDELTSKYADLTESQKSVLRTLEWLQSMRVFTFPEEVLAVLHRFFQNDDANLGSDLEWEATIKRLTARPARFVRVDERVEAQAVLLERYDFGRWFRNNFFRNFFKKRKNASRPRRVVEPLNVHYLNLEELDQEGSRAEHAQNITTILEQQPEAVIDVLERYPAAVETLVLLGDAYLNHLGETIDNAAELALKCYEAALRRLDKGEMSEQFPGVWAAAHIGKGTAELRLERYEEADANFRAVHERPVPGEGLRSIPAMLVARAWHGRGDVIAAQISRHTVTSKLDDAAEYYEQAAKLLPPNDALAVETRLDRANVLYEIACINASRYEHSLSHVPIQAPIDIVAEARKAYEKAQAAYSYSSAPAVRAEIQRRLGELRLMETLWLLPAEMHMPPYKAETTDPASAVLSDEKKAFETAKIARDHFIAARNVFAPSYLPMSWIQTQIDLMRALLVIARIAGEEARSHDEKTRASDIYWLSLVTANTVDKQNSMLAQSPLEWIDIQLLRAKAEIGRASLDESRPQDYFKAADAILDATAESLGVFERMVEKSKPERVAEQRSVLNALRKEIKRV